MKDEFLFYEEGMFVSKGDKSGELFLMETSVEEGFLNRSSAAGVHPSYNNNTTTSSTQFNIEDILGPRRGELYKTIAITVIYCIIFITGVFGNVCTCVVIARNRYMHTTTNYYLFNLAISDLLVLLFGLPQETYSFWSAYPWIFGETFCVVRVMAAETSTYASILTITAFTVERYVAIVHPMRAQAVSSLPRAVKVIVFIWVVSAVCSVPLVVQFGIKYHYDAHDRPLIQTAVCDIIPERYLEHTFEISTFLFFVTPMTVITVLYLLIGVAVRRSTLHRSGSDSSHTKDEANGSDLRGQQQARARRAVLKMLVAVVVAFFICWAPFHTQRLLVIYFPEHRWTPDIRAFSSALYLVSGVLYYVSSVINPILYNIMSLKFRRAFAVTIFRPCKRERRKRNSFVAYKFCNGHLKLDGDLSISQLQKNGFVVPRPCNGCKKLSRSLSSHSSGHHTSKNHHSEPMEFLITKEENAPQRHSLVDGKPFTRPQFTTPPDVRPYHSYA